jgi:hypothetical protein
VWWGTPGAHLEGAVAAEAERQQAGLGRADAVGGEVEAEQAGGVAHHLWIGEEVAVRSQGAMEGGRERWSRQLE